MKNAIRFHVLKTLARVTGTGELPVRLDDDVLVTAGNVRIPVEIMLPKDKGHGDFALNLAMQLAKPLRANPRKLGEDLKRWLDDGRPEWLDPAEVAGPGFLNFRIRPEGWHGLVDEMLAAGPLALSGGQYRGFGAVHVPSNEKINIEFVSANPTGPMHVGHGRGAAFGDTMARILRATGNDVTAEFYVNDAGLQVDNLGESLFYHARQLAGLHVNDLEVKYQGEYVKILSVILLVEALAPDRVDALVNGSADDEFPDLLPRTGRVLEVYELAAKGGESPPLKEDLHEKAREFLNDHAKALAFFKVAGSAILLGHIRRTLRRFNVVFDRYFSERQMVESGVVDRTIEQMKARGVLVLKDGAWQLEKDSLEDEKDRVVVRSNGVKTYFASDIAYHEDKFSRGYQRLINVWGADHHGYIPRVRGAMKLLGHDPERLIFRILQFVLLMEGGQQGKMSKRQGNFVTLEEVMTDVGVDACRWFFLSRSHDQTIEFDLELARKQSNENPVYYVQYGYARIASILRKAAGEGVPFDPSAPAKLGLLVAPEEIALIRKAAEFPDVVLDCARALEPHHLTFYLIELVRTFSNYYSAKSPSGETLYKVVDAAQPELSRARLKLSAAMATVIRGGLELLGISAPDRMDSPAGEG